MKPQVIQIGLLGVSFYIFFVILFALSTYLTIIFQKRFKIKAMEVQQRRNSRFKRTIKTKKPSDYNDLLTKGSFRNVFNEAHLKNNVPSKFFWSIDTSPSEPKVGFLSFDPILGELTCITIEDGIRCFYQCYGETKMHQHIKDDHSTLYLKFRSNSDSSQVITY